MSHSNFRILTESFDFFLTKFITHVPIIQKNSVSSEEEFSIGKVINEDSEVVREAVMKKLKSVLDKVQKEEPKKTK